MDFARTFAGRWPVATSLALCAPLVSACATTGLHERYDTLTQELQRADAEAHGEAEAEVDLATGPGGSLSRSAFVRAVLARNPDLAAAREAWRMAVAQYEAAGRPPDPTVSYSFAPLSIGGSSRYGQTVEVRQGIPFPGKLGLERAVQLAEAEAAQEDFVSVRLELALMASELFDGYYAVGRSLALNAEHQSLLETIKGSAEAQYSAGGASQQAPLQAEVELAEIARERLRLEAQIEVLEAQMNGLLHREPDRPLPPPPEGEQPIEVDPNQPEALQREAIAHRPEFEAMERRLVGKKAAIDLAERGFYPDLGVMGSYSTMWASSEHRFMVGASVEVPIWVGKQRAEVDRAEADLAELRATHMRHLDRIRVEVERARQLVLESDEEVDLFEQRLLPAARSQVKAARIGYQTGRSGFQALIDAERNLRRIELQLEETRAERGRRRAALVRAVGKVPGLAKTEAGPVDRGEAPEPNPSPKGGVR